MILKNCYDQWIPNIENMVFLAKQRDELLEACIESNKRIKFLLDKILIAESFPEKIILERIEIDKTFACMSYTKQAITAVEDST